MTHTRAVDTRALRWLEPPDGPAVVLLDQTRLPAEEAWLTCRDILPLSRITRLLLLQKRRESAAARQTSWNFKEPSRARARTALPRPLLDSRANEA